MENKRVKYVSVEYVSPGHPDKVCDVIAECIVDEFFDQDINSRVAVDGACKGKVFLCGEITSSADVDIEQVARRAIDACGYFPRDNRPQEESANFNWRDTPIELNFTQQSPDIAMGVDRYDNLLEKTAGDQGMCISGAIKESPNFVSHAQEIARIIGICLWEDVMEEVLEWARQDIKTQVTIKYENEVPVEVTDVVVSISHEDEISLEDIRKFVKVYVQRILDKYGEENNLKVDNVNFFVNATGKFAVYGPQSDSGEVGRKIVCDQTGGIFAVGGGNLNGKDATKVDRTGAYGARYAAKNVVAANLATKCEVNVAYCIGVKDPVSVTVNCFGTNKIPEQQIEEAVKAVFDFTPGGMIKQFNMISDIETRGWKYEDLAKFGHIGNPCCDNLPWEQVDKVQELLDYLK